MKASKVEQASGRLDRAVRRLETAVSQRLQRAAAEGDPGALELEAAQAETERLRGLHATAAARLDATIARLSQLLDD